jgi:nitrogen fixation/metabolism regulation signal transduction histidine kinase
LVGALLGIAIALLAAFLISSGIAKTISEAVNAIASSSTEIAATVEQQERTATQQSSYVHQTTIQWMSWALLPNNQQSLPKLVLNLDRKL